MNSPRLRLSPSHFLALAFAFAATLRAQTAPAASSLSPAAKTETVTLSPFEVRTDKDTSYGALNSNSIAAFNMELLKAPVVDYVESTQ